MRTAVFLVQSGWCSRFSLIDWIGRRLLRKERMEMRSTSCLFIGLAAIITTSVAISLPSWGITNESLDISVAQNRCCSCSGAFPREAARLCGSCSNKYSSKCCLCSGAFPTDIARLCGSCSNKYRSKCFICSGAFPKEVGRLCSRCTSKY